MENLIENLKTRYEVVLQSSSDSQFYLNIHAYIDLIRKTPFLSKIMDDSENEYRRQHIAIWPDKSKTDEEADEREERTIRLERFNLYTAHFCWLEARIYDPIEDYKNTDAPDDEQDPVALLLVKGIKNIKTKKWSDRTLKMYNRWFDGKRERYENDLRQFHVDFLSELRKLEEPIKKSDDTKTKIHIDGQKGIYRDDNDKLSYPVGRITKRFKLIKYLFSKDNCPLVDLGKETNQSKDVVMKSIAEINKLFRNNLQVVNDLILSIPTGGYSLNKKVFDIEINL